METRGNAETPPRLDFLDLAKAQLSGGASGETWVGCGLCAPGCPPRDEKTKGIVYPCRAKRLDEAASATGMRVRGICRDHRGTAWEMHEVRPLVLPQ